MVLSCQLPPVRQQQPRPAGPVHRESPVWGRRLPVGAQR